MVLRYAFLRVAFAVSLTAFTTPIASQEVEAAKAGRRIGAAAAGVIAGRAAAASVRDRSSEAVASEDGEKAVGDVQPADGSASSTDQTPARAFSAKIVQVAPTAQRGIEVPGCAPGKLCIVCIAGCNTEANEIVHSIPKGLRAD